MSTDSIIFSCPINAAITVADAMGIAKALPGLPGNVLSSPHRAAPSSFVVEYLK
jgi:hypothetical protein